MRPNIQIMLADDHKVVRQGLRQLFSLTPDITVAGETGNGQELLSLLQLIQCDILLLDMTMPGLCGIDLIKRIKLKLPALLILVYSMHNECQLVSRAFKAGVKGYAMKDSDPKQLIVAVRKILRGGKYIDASLVDTMIFDRGLDQRDPHTRLTDREFQIFQLLITGKSVTAIGQALSLSSKTISTHKFRLFQKLDITSIAQLTRYAIDHQLMVPGIVS